MFTLMLPDVSPIASFVDVKQHGYRLCPVRLTNMREAYETQLAQIDIALVAMADLVGTAIRGATEALLADDLTMAEIVIAGDAEINKLNADVEEISLLIAALQAPMATDLRLVMGAIRISGSLERMGDLAVHIAKQVRLRYPSPSIPAELRDTFKKMGQAASKIVEQTGEIIATRNTGLADEMNKFDDILDNLHRELFTVVLSDDWAHGVESAIDVTLLSRFYERFGDHAVSVSRRIIQIVTGAPYSK
ncbi:MAG: phosphate transport system regulatory protein PhoU [Actinomycetota bacterium]|jgi:phosphate transport system protein